jgi:3-phenylpropionate/cinnamic acid dioxygenase small subunit
MRDQRDRLAYFLLKQELEEFLYYEAELLDERRFEAWLELLTDDVRYWMPLRRNVKFAEMEREFTREGLDINWFDEGKDTLTRRVQQILTGVHWAEEPLSRLCHMVSNVQLLDVQPSALEPAEVTVKCRFLVYRSRVETETDILVGIGPSGSGRRDMQERQLARRLQICFPERGHQTGVYLLPKDRPTPPAYQDSPVVSAYFSHCEEERRRRRGEWGRLIGSPGEIFPNTALHPRQPRTIAVWHPRGPHQTEVWRWYLVDQQAPPEVKDFLRQYYIRYSGPAGLTEQDDMENWNYAHAASRGTIARRYPYCYEQGMGFEMQNFAWEGLQLPGVVMDITEAKSSEHNLRNLYRRWAEFMEAESWDELATWRRAGLATQTNGQSTRG